MVDLRISSARLIPYTIRLSAGSIAGRERTGRLVRLETSDGNVGWGDTAPLLEFSRETIDDVDKSWETLSAKVSGGRKLVWDQNEPWRMSVELGTPSCPSLTFGLEQALTGLTADILGIRSSDVIAPGWHSTVQIAGLITGSGERALEQARSLANHGYRALKIKVGRHDLGREAETVLAIRAVVGDDVELRLDANRAWTLDEAAEFIEATQTVRPAFIEEPLAEPLDARKLWEITGAAIALDETLLEIEPPGLGAWSFVTHLVVKPTLLGGITASETFIAAGKQLGITPVVSACYESGLGISILACLAARWCPEGPAAGLDTYSRLETDVLRRKLKIGHVIRQADLVFAPESVETENR